MFIEITRGRSFKGLAQYCLHDADRKGDSRVAFVQTQNLGTDDPQLAWRIMSARHYLQEELKENSGVSRGGAKDGKPVGHVVLSWKREEADAERLSHQGMLSAAQGALRAIGASDRQALIIGHSDTPHPHCHIIVNLIGDDGRLKKNWKEREKLSQFALQRERKIHGAAFVKQREKNWQEREAGQTPVPVKKQPRHLHELEKAAKNCPQTKQFSKEHRKQLVDLAQSRETQKERHKRHQERLLQCHAERKRRIETRSRQQVQKSRSDLQEAHQQKVRKLQVQQELTSGAFNQNEQSLKGSLSNAMQLIDWKKLLRRKRDAGQAGWAEAFKLLTNESARKEKLKKQQQAEQEKLQVKQRREERETLQRLQKERAARVRDERNAYLRKADAMKERQQRSRERLKEQQQTLSKRRSEVIKVQQAKERQRKLDWARKVLLQEKEPRQKANDNRIRQPKPVVKERAMPAELQRPSLEEIAVQPSQEPEQTPVVEKTKAPEQKPTRTRRERKERQPREPRHPEASMQPETPPPPQVQQAGDRPQTEKLREARKPEDDFRERMMKHLRERDEQDLDRER